MSRSLRSLAGPDGPPTCALRQPGGLDGSSGVEVTGGEARLADLAVWPRFEPVGARAGARADHVGQLTAGEDERGPVVGGEACREPALGDKTAVRGPPLWLAGVVGA